MGQSHSQKIVKEAATFLRIGFGFLTLTLLSCSPPAADKEQATTTDKTQLPPLSEAEAEQAVAQRFDAHRYVLSDFIPKPGAPPPAPITPRRTIKIGLYWVLNDELSPWYVGIDKGFFADEGLDLEFLEGGPNRDTLSSLLANRVDLYIGAPENILFVINSRTGADLKMICATLKETPVGWIGIDHSIPSNQHSTREIGRADLLGRKIGVQPGGEYQITIINTELGFAPGDLQVMTAGATPDALVAGAIDYYEGFQENQPRVLEHNGIMNWTFFPLSKIGYHDYFDVTAVTADYYKQNPDVLAAYVYALNRAIEYEIAHPEEAADIVSRHTLTYPATREDALWRIKRDVKIYVGDGSEPVLAMNPAVVQKQLALLYRFHQIELPAAPASH